ncbi:MAG TPA: DUF5652 family protein [Patescibacteria group bacterium]|nr:DUF5652 family protein [Patescibacteria group bacterium]
MNFLSQNQLLGLLILLWVLPWTGIALWKAAKRGEKVWFIVMFVINTFGLLEIFYIFVVAKELSFWQKIKAKFKSFFKK